MSNQPETKQTVKYEGREKLGERLLEARKKTGLSRDDVISKVNASFSRSSLQAWESGEREPNLDNIFVLAEIYDTSAWFIIAGDKEAASNAKEVDQEENYTFIPAYDIEVSAGHGMFSEGAKKAHKQLAFRKRWVQSRGLDAKHLAVLFTKGDSMEPTIPENAAIVVDMARNQALDGKVYVIRIDNRLYVKRTQWVPGGLRLLSDNKFYDPLDITEKDFSASNIEVIGQVIHAAYDLPD